MSAVPKEQCLAESIDNYIASTSAPKPLPLDKIREATMRDPTLIAVMRALTDGKWHVHRKSTDINAPTYDSCQVLQEELSASTDRDLLLRGGRIVISAALQHDVIQLAHSGHQGLVKTKELLREKVWFRAIDKLTEEVVRSCFRCQIATPVCQREPLMMSPLPIAPWTELSMDFGHAEWPIHYGSDGWLQSLSVRRSYQLYSSHYRDPQVG